MQAARPVREAARGNGTDGNTVTAPRADLTSPPPSWTTCGAGSSRTPAGTAAAVMTRCTGSATSCAPARTASPTADAPAEPGQPQKSHLALHRASLNCARRDPHCCTPRRDVGEHHAIRSDGCIRSDRHAANHRDARVDNAPTANAWVGSLDAVTRTKCDALIDGHLIFYDCSGPDDDTRRVREPDIADRRVRMYVNTPASRQAIPYQRRKLAI